jgi:hypothetical protein
MPLVAEVPPASVRPLVMEALMKEIKETQNGHLDTGLHGTYVADMIADTDHNC